LAILYSAIAQVITFSRLIENVSVSGAFVEGTSFVGGLVGLLEKKSKIIDSSSSAEVRASIDIAGGLAGRIADASITDCYAYGNVYAPEYAGGLVGMADRMGVIIGATAMGDVHAKSYAGGLVGSVGMYSSVTGGIATGNVSAEQIAGGLVGLVNISSSISQSGAYGNVSVDRDTAGGLIGSASGATISDSFAQGNVSGATYVAGLISRFGGSTSNNSVENCYSTGIVTGTDSTATGAFCAQANITFLGTNFYDASKASVSNAYSTGSPAGDASAYPQGRSTEQMMALANYEGWDFENIWTINEGAGYPGLK
jgi:hypothetical protein